jgi:hypothetical protein
MATSTRSTATKSQTRRPAGRNAGVGWYHSSNRPFPSGSDGATSAARPFPSISGRGSEGREVLAWAFALHYRNRESLRSAFSRSSMPRGKVAK